MHRSFHLVVNSVIYFTNEADAESFQKRPTNELAPSHSHHSQRLHSHHHQEDMVSSLDTSHQDTSHQDTSNSRQESGHQDNISNDGDVSKSLPPNCRSKHEHIMFLKTHKCGSTTLQNVFLRFGDGHNLFFVLPSRHNYLGHPSRFNRRLILDPLILKRRFNLTYSILAHHTRFQYKELMAVLPPDSAFITILRNPVSHFESLYEYLDLGKSWPGIPPNSTFRQFLEAINDQANYTQIDANQDNQLVNQKSSNQKSSNQKSSNYESQLVNGPSSQNSNFNETPSQNNEIHEQSPNSWSLSNLLSKLSNNRVSSAHDQSTKPGERASSVPSLSSLKHHKIDLNYRFRGKFGRNQMSFDLGFNERFFESTNIASNFVDAIDSIFSLVLISERMEESLILLRHLLCWSLEDVVTFRHNSRREEIKARSMETKVDNFHKEIIRKFNMADDLLYQHFNQKFDAMVKKFGVSRMRKEVESLRNLTNEYYEKCVDSLKPMKQIVPAKYWSSSKVLGIKQKTSEESKNDITCSRLTMSEMIFTDKLRRKQQLILRNKKLGFNTDFAAFHAAFERIDQSDHNLDGATTLKD